MRWQCNHAAGQVALDDPDAGQRAEQERTIDVEVQSAFELDDAAKSKLAAALRDRLGRDVRLHCEIDQELIGGVIVRAGDLVMDGSVRDRLAQLADNITA